MHSLVRKLTTWSLAVSLGTLALLGHALHSGHHHGCPSQSRHAHAGHEHLDAHCEHHHYHGHCGHSHAKPTAVPETAEGPETADGFLADDGALDHECAICHLLGKLRQGSTPSPATAAAPVAERHLLPPARAAAIEFAARYSSRAPPALA